MIKFDEDRGSVRRNTTYDVKIKELLSIEDKELQEYIYLREGKISEVVDRHVDTDEKIGYYRFIDTLKMNRKGTFYVDSKLCQWLVYRKATKKVSISSNHDSVYGRLLSDYFYNTYWIHELPIKPTPTLCKKIIEGSINTLGDFVKYARSYVIKKKDLPIETVYRFMMAKKMNYLQCIENPQDIKCLEEITGTNLHSGITMGNSIRFRIENIKEQNEVYDKWCREQDNKLAAVKGRRYDGFGSYACQVATI